jgi:hypothetical protein
MPQLAGGSYLIGFAVLPVVAILASRAFVDRHGAAGIFVAAAIAASEALPIVPKIGACGAGSLTLQQLQRVASLFDLVS